MVTCSESPGRSALPCSGCSARRILLLKPYQIGRSGHPHLIKGEGMSESPELVSRSIVRTRDEVCWLLTSRREGVRSIWDHRSCPDRESPCVHSCGHPLAHSKPTGRIALRLRAQIQDLTQAPPLNRSMTLSKFSSLIFKNGDNNRAYLRELWLYWISPKTELRALNCSIRVIGFKTELIFPLGWPTK